MIRSEVRYMERALRSALGAEHVHRVVAPAEAPLPQLAWAREGGDTTTTLFDGETHIPVVILTVYAKTFEAADGFLSRALAVLGGAPGGPPEPLPQGADPDDPPPGWDPGDRARLRGGDGDDPPLEPGHVHLAQAPDDPVDDYNEETQEYIIETSVMLRTD